MQDFLLRGYGSHSDGHAIWDLCMHVIVPGPSHTAL
jgi:hypothetical protein